jgi:Protein of unknown function (DUF1579)
MKLLACCVFLALGSALPTSCAADEESLPTQFPEPAGPTAEHAWLQQLVGDWTITSSSTMDPTKAPTEMKGSETVRTIGGLWVVGEGQADMNGTPLHTMITIGYDPARKAFVGTWVDSSQAFMWLYEGHLDDTRRILALDAEGPSFVDPTKRVSYRDSIEIKGADHRTLTSEVRNPDGTWTTMMRADYHRKP